VWVLRRGIPFFQEGDVRRRSRPSPGVGGEKGKTVGKRSLVNTPQKDCRGEKER